MALTENHSDVRSAVASSVNWTARKPTSFARGGALADDANIPLWLIATAVRDEPPDTWSTALLKDRARGPLMRYLSRDLGVVTFEVDPANYETLLGRRGVEPVTMPDETLPGLDSWRGLQVYEESHQGMFFGREQELADWSQCRMIWALPSCSGFVCFGAAETLNSMRSVFFDANA